MSHLRIQKALAEMGVASRRAVEQMVLDGRITVNGSVVTKLPCFVDLSADEIRVDGQRVSRRQARKVYILLNKPRGVVCTQRDPGGRPRAVDLVPAGAGRLYCVGRLDLSSTGLILLTNDGDLTEFLTHPRHGVVKTYVVEVEGAPGAAEMEKLRRGVYLDGRPARGAKLRVLHRGARRSMLEIRLAEGRNREIRRTLARLGYKVRRLKRTAIGPVTDRGLKIGRFRYLTPAEVSRLRRGVGQARKRPREKQDGR